MQLLHLWIQHLYVHDYIFVSSGNVLGSRYKSNSVWASIKGTILYGNYVMTTAQ